ncbi:MAG: type II secretion system F family protein [Firmicutes bacterium]|nr:type II secretion system F family protein [Bacillota bacterium]
MDQARELISFTKHLYYLTRMGAPLSESFRKIRNNIAGGDLREAVISMADKMDEGRTLSSAMSEYSKLFPPDYVKMIEAAESCETLPQVLGELSSYLESVEKARRALQSAALYPGLILNFMFIFIGLVWYFASDSIFTQYVIFIKEIGGNLSPLTWFFIGAAKVIFNPVFMIIWLVLVLAVDISLFTKLPIGTNFILKTPVLSELFKKAYYSRISRALGFMLKQGVSLDAALPLVEKTADSNIVQETLRRMGERVRQGKTLADSMKEEPLFNETFVFMVRHGEEKEELPGSLLEIADFYDDDIKGTYDSFIKMAEPVFLASTGLIVGFLAVTIFMPFYQITGAIN